MSRVYKPLSCLGKIVTGKTPSTEIKELWGGDIPFITPTDISRFDTFYLQKTERTISEEGASKQIKTLLPPNSICITCIGSTIGKPCITKTVSITNQQINSIIVNSQNDYRYIYYLMRFNLPYLQLISGGSGSGTPIISKNKFSKFKFLVEDVFEYQSRIASILSAYDNLIENNTRRIRLLEQMAENIYKEWFVRFRFPGHENAEFENGLPKGWKIERYGNVTNISAGGDRPICFSEVKTNEYKIPIYSNGIDNFGLYGYTNEAKIKEECITISARGTVGYVCLRKEPFVPIVRLLSVIPQKGLDLYYLFHSSKSNDLEGNGTSQQQLTAPMLSKRKILIPSKQVMDGFGKIVRQFYDEINVLQQQSNLLARQRDLLLPRLMSGKLEVH